jgi:hypothetical protein
MDERTGGCQCGRVRYRVVGEPKLLAVCHCRECQRHSGGAFGMSMLVMASNVTVEGELKLFERTSESGRTVGSCFCPECGTRIYTIPSLAPGFLSLKPGTLDDTSWLRPQLHVWTSSKQDWFEVPADAKQHERQP